MNDVFAPVVLEVLDVQHLCVGIVVNARDRGVGGVGDVHDVHVVPAGQVCVGLSVGRCGHLHLGVSGRGEGVEIKQFHVVGSKLMLAGVFVVVTFALNERIFGVEHRGVPACLLHVVAKNQHRR